MNVYVLTDFTFIGAYSLRNVSPINAHTKTKLNIFFYFGLKPSKICKTKEQFSFQAFNTMSIKVVELVFLICDFFHRKGDRIFKFEEHL